MDDAQRIVKCGNLSLHTAGGFFKKKWHSKYLVLYDGSKSGIKRLELFDSEIKFKKQNAAKIIPLVDCVRVVTCQRNKTTYTFEVRTSEQFYLLAAQSFQDMNDWVNCLRLVAFGEATNGKQQQGITASTVTCPSLNLASKRPQQQQQQQQHQQQQHKQTGKEQSAGGATIDVLLDKRNAPNSSNQLNAASIQFNPTTGSGVHQQQQSHVAKITTASQAIQAASSALAKTRQRQPSLLGSCKPQPPTDSPFIQQQQQQQQQQQSSASTNLNCAEPQLLTAIGGQIDTLTPTVRGQLIGLASNKLVAAAAVATTRQPTVSNNSNNISADRQATGTGTKQQLQSKKITNTIQATLDEEEENMLYCSIEDNPSEHNYRVKVIESELSLRCQLKCYQLTTPNTVSQQYDQIGNFKPGSGAYQAPSNNQQQMTQMSNVPVTFYQLIVGPQELTLLNDYAVGGNLSANKQQQGLWSWPYQCIRRYGFDKDNCFMFEAGRKCTSGPGQFIVQTPKAYSIYQDVVKFVNELRCVNGGSGGGGGLGSVDQPQQVVPQKPAKEGGSNVIEEEPVTNAVTHIPVSWAPTTGCIDSRQNFFDSLRQMNNNQPQPHLQLQPQPQPQPQPQQHKQQASSSPLEHQNHQQEPKQQPNNGHDKDKVNNNIPAQTSKNFLLEQQSTNQQRNHSNYPPSSPHYHHHYLNSSSSNSNNNHLHHHLMHRNTDTIPELCEHTSTSCSSSSSSSSSTSSSLSKASGNLAKESSKNCSIGLKESQSSGPKRPNSSDVTSEETDESGYEQGDDSVDSSSSRSRMLANELKKCHSSSMSSSSSTTSSNGASGSGSSSGNASGPPPLYSVIQRPRPAKQEENKQQVQQQELAPISRRWPPPIKPPSPEIRQRHDPMMMMMMKTTTMNNNNNSNNNNNNNSVMMKTSNTEKLLSRLIVDRPTNRQHDQDFEANLIRDVYSEITKLHATFAVTPYSE